MDFALWKAAKEGEPQWPSPWGPGRPGWHIECSAMCLRHLGETVDIHGGGQDLIFPHHENEIAQSEGFTGRPPFARFWMHNGLLQLGEEKMSKSLGNLVTVKEALARWSPDALRLFVLSSYYRNPLKFSEESVDAAERGVQRLRYAPTVAAKGQGVPLDAAPYRQRFIEAMDDDFNTPQAIAALFDLAREINRFADEGGRVEAAQAALSELAGVLGLTLEEPAARGHADAAPFIDLLVELRTELRKAKRFDLADVVRQRLAGLGIALEDTPQGTRWRPGR
jgi:cysteinyl-tRNA synthetase